MGTAEDRIHEDISNSFLRTQDIIENLHKRIRELKSNTQFTKEELEELLGLMYTSEFDSYYGHCLSCEEFTHTPGCRWVALLKRIREELEKMEAESQK